MWYRLPILRHLSIALATMLVSPGSIAETDQQRAQNLATCLSGQFPNLCRHEWLSSSERQAVDQAEHGANLRTCLTGQFPSLCNRATLSAAEAKQVATAEHDANLRTCLTGQFPNLCNRAMLNPAEAKQVENAEHAENLRICLTGQFPTLCNNAKLTLDEAKQVAAAETRVREAQPAASLGKPRVGYAPRYTSGCEADHWINSVEGNGEVVTLEDGSVWLVDDVDTVDSSLWLPTTDIVACDGKLINIDDDESVWAERIR